jgi:outer membrane protein assembly factor BamB
LIVDDRVLVSLENDVDSTLLCLDKKSGEVAWQVDRSEFPRGFVSPLVWESNGRRQIVLAGALRVVGYDFLTGKEVWTIHGLARLCCSTPALGPDGTLYVNEWSAGSDEGDRIEMEPWPEFVTAYDKDQSGTIEDAEIPAGPLRSRYPQIDRDKDGRVIQMEYDWMRNIFHSARNVCLAVRPGGEGDITESHVEWTRSEHLSYVPSPAYYGGNLFTVKNGGIVASIDAETGETLKAGRAAFNGSYYASPSAGDGKVYLLDQTGGLTVISAEPQWEVLHVAEFGEEIFASPALAGGQVFVRTSGNLFCFGAKE